MKYILPYNLYFFHWIYLLILNDKLNLCYNSFISKIQLSKNKYAYFARLYIINFSGIFAPREKYLASPKLHSKNKRIKYTVGLFSVQVHQGLKNKSYHEFKQYYWLISFPELIFK